MKARRNLKEGISGEVPASSLSLMDMQHWQNNLMKSCGKLNFKACGKYLHGSHFLYFDMSQQVSPVGKFNRMIHMDLKRKYQCRSKSFESQQVSLERKLKYSPVVNTFHPNMWVIVTCVDSWVPLSMKPSVQPVMTAMTDSVSSPCLFKKVLRLLFRYPVPWRKVFTRSPIVLPASPGAYEPWSERASSSPLGKRSSSMPSKFSVGLRYCVRLAGDKPVESRRRSNLFHWGIKSSRSEPTAALQAGCRQTYSHYKRLKVE